MKLNFKTSILFILALFVSPEVGFSQHRSSSHSTSHSTSRSTSHSSYHTAPHSTYHYTYHKSRSTFSPHHYAYGGHRSNYSSGASRDKHGKIKRSGSARYQFMKQSGYNHGRKGYVIDHIVPLYKGGCDCPSNMQWQTIEQAKQKDKTE